MPQPFFAYILECGDGSFYVGHTDDLAKRVSEHQAGVGSEWTSKRLPVRLAWSQELPTREEAKAAEQQIKGWSRAKKAALIRGDFGSLRRLAGRAKMNRKG